MSRSPRWVSSQVSVEDDVPLVEPFRRWSELFRHLRVRQSFAAPAVDRRRLDQAVRYYSGKLGRRYIVRRWCDRVRVWRVA
jgi:hypothetical protein